MPVQEATLDTGWPSSEVSDVCKDAKMGSPIVDNVIVDPPFLVWTGIRPQYILACGSTCAPLVMLRVFVCFHST